MSTQTGFREVYRNANAYEQLLLPHFFDGRTDGEVVADILANQFGSGYHGSLRIAEFGCGTGRITRHLEAYARELVCVDSSPSMIETIGGQFPAARALCLDTRAAVSQLCDEDRVGGFDLVTAFWSLNYPLGEFFEQLTADGITPVTDLAAARRQASAFIDALVSLVATDGRLLVLMFDPDTAEQRLVTSLWEQVAPSPPGGRGYTRELLLERLHDAEARGQGSLTCTRLPGVAVASDRPAAVKWFTGVHLKGLGQLVHDPAVLGQVNDFVDLHTAASGKVLIPAGVHVIDYRATTGRHHHLPTGEIR